MRVAWPIRTSANYELTRLDALPEGHRAVLRSVRSANPNLYALLSPAPGYEGTLKLVDRATFALLVELREAASPPAASPQLTKLVLDGVLECWNGESFVSGVDALARVVDIADDPPLAGHLAVLSRQALLRAESRIDDDLDQLAEYLYSYHTLPREHEELRAFDDDGTVRRHLRRATGEATWSRLCEIWEGKRLPKSRHWLTWSRPRLREPVDPSRPTFKLYVSTSPASLGEAFAACVDVFEETARRFKVGAETETIRRGDKLVAYFPSRDQLMRTAEKIAPRVAGFPTHGVPFTAQLDGDGLLSWGLDPPRDDRPDWLGRESWRSWVTRRLAAYLLAARQSRPPSPSASRFAIERARLDGIDVERWIPTESIWAC